jgi:hypothetical protein
MPFGSLWLPVVVSAVAVWLVSAILHMALRYHRADYKKLAEEDAVAAALGKGSPPPGYYVLPHCLDPAQMKKPEVQEKYKRGPVAFIAVVPSGLPNMGKPLALWLLFCLLTSFVTAYVARHTLVYDAAALAILRVTGTVAFVGYGFGAFQESIWRGMPWSNTVRSVIDALVYALVTGLVFRWLWPAG